MIVVRTDGPETWLVMEKDGIEIGRACAELIRPDQRDWLFKGSFILPDYRRQGVYRELWDARLSFVMAQNPRSIEGWSGTGNRSLFIADGFIAVNRNWKHYEDELFMRKIL